MNFDLREVPFSRYGSYFAFSHLGESKYHKDGLYLRNIRGGDDDLGCLFKIELIYNGQSVDFEEIVSPSILRLQSEYGFADICIAESDIIRIKSKDVGMRFVLIGKSYDNVVKVNKERWEVNSYTNEIRVMLSSIKGELDVDAPWNVHGCDRVVADFNSEKESNIMECALEAYSAVCKNKNYYGEFQKWHKDVIEDFEKWFNNTLDVSQEFKAAKELASYITWSCVVNEEGILKRPAMYMSKNWMTNIWSWNHCFNAMALVKNNPQLAWDQFMLFTDYQDECGVFPDFVNNKFASWSCCKPPIHGWVLKWMMERSDFFTKERLNEIYEPLCRWTNYWFEYRDNDKNGIPQYNHANDCGWDNSTIFRKGAPVESPDLCSFLIIQMDTLSEIAFELGKEQEGCMWKIKADMTIDRMINRFWKKDRFTAFLSGTDEEVNGDSLILYIPIILGRRFPENIRTKLIQGLKEKGRFLTKNGFATESLKSELYSDDGYWRGPIWAPSTMILIDGLLSSGESEFSKEIALRFCKMASKSGMAENYDAVTGEGLRDRAFTSTSSVFLILGNEYL